MGGATYQSLKTMSDKDCGKLFRKHAFHNVEPSVCLEEIGKEIVKKCKGLPLAVMSLAGLLCSVSDPKEWREILKSDVWELQEKGNDEILPSLWLSYSYLPSHLKRCFAYCSIFPKDYKYNKQEMVLLWMAEGILQGENMEDHGERCVNILISRSLFQQSADDESMFLLHDLVHDLATYVSGKGFCIGLGTSNGVESLTDKTRHLVCDRSGVQDYCHTCKGISRDNHLRTFLVLRRSDLAFDEFLRKFGSLRVLGISNCNVTKVPNTIGKLKHLRYLDLSATEFECLPDTICNLYNLQTLLLRGCRNLTHLPDKIENLVKLRRLDISGTSSLKNIPRQMYELEALRGINKFIVGSENKINMLTKFPYSSGCLEIHGIENIAEFKQVLEAHFEEKRLVTELILRWGSGTNDSAKDRAILDAMKPHPNLRKLAIEGYGGKEFSDWVADHTVSNITDVSLLNCSHCSKLPPFGQLPSLRVLKMNKLQSVKKMSSEFHGSSGGIPFLSLEILEIKSMEELQRWSSFNAEAYPRLRELTLVGCPMLNSTLPRFLPSLKELCIEDCAKMEALLRIDLATSSASPSLKTMYAMECRKLKFSGLPLPFPTTLNYLRVNSCKIILISLPLPST